MSAAILGDTLAPRLYLHKDDKGAIHAPCPICGTDTEEDPDARLTLVGDVAYGRVVLKPCGHEIGSVAIDPRDDR